MLIKPLTSLRFFFALLVFMHHTRAANHHPTFFGKVYQLLSSEGFTGVSFFFILSGFVLSLNYSEPLLGKSISPRQFWVARLARIYPLHIVTLALAVLLGGPEFEAGFWPGILKLLLHLFLLQSFIPVQDIYFAFNVPAWSISDEWFFYLLFPWLIVFFDRYRRALPLALLYLVSVPLGIWLTPGDGHHRFFYVNPLWRLADFVIGILLFRLYQGKQLHHWFSSAAKAGLWEICAVFMLLIFLGGHNHIARGFRYSSYYWPPMALFIFVFAHARGVVSRLLSGRLLVHLGEISFGFYMFHHLVIRLVTAVNKQYQFTGNAMLLTGIMFTVTLVVSHFSFLYFERPCNRLVKTWFSGK